MQILFEKSDLHEFTYTQVYTVYSIGLAERS